MPSFQELLADDWHAELGDVTKQVIRTLVTEAIEAQRQEISVHDRLPTPEKRVLWWNVPLERWHIGHFCPSKDYPPGYFEENHGLGSIICYVYCGHVTHWMPLSPPPEELPT